jgi:hypothetical protein
MLDFIKDNLIFSFFKVIFNIFSRTLPKMHFCKFQIDFFICFKNILKKQIIYYNVGIKITEFIMTKYLTL